MLPTLTFEKIMDGKLKYVLDINGSTTISCLNEISSNLEKTIFYEINHVKAELTKNIMIAKNNLHIKIHNEKFVLKRKTNKLKESPFSSEILKIELDKKLAAEFIDLDNKFKKSMERLDKKFNKESMNIDLIHDKIIRHFNQIIKAQTDKICGTNFMTGPSHEIGTYIEPAFKFIGLVPGYSLKIDDVSFKRKYDSI